MNISPVKKDIASARAGIQSIIETQSKARNVDGFGHLIKAVDALDKADGKLDDAAEQVKERADKRAAKDADKDGKGKGKS